MKKIKFTSTEIYESEGRNKGPVFNKGSVHEFEDQFADRWLRRGVAVPFEDALDHDHDGRKGGAVEPAGDPASVEDIVAAIGLLDPGNDDHWTSAGLPTVETIAQLSGKTVTRAAIAAAAPDAKRPEA